MIIIGIDPGKHNGYAEYYNGKLKTVTSLQTWAVISRLQSQILPYKVYIEDPTTWKPFKNTDSQSHKLKGAGSVTARFWAIVEYLEDHNIQFVKVPIQGTAKKMNAKMFEKVTGWAERTNEHGRDAAMLVFNRK
jgi:hypothetical protein